MLALGTLGLAVILIAIPQIWERLEELIEKVKNNQEKELERVAEWVGRWPVDLAVLVAPSWVALLMIRGLTTGQDPMEILMGALVVSATGIGNWRNPRSYAIGLVPATILADLILYTRPLIQAGAVVLASWILLLGAIRINWDNLRLISLLVGAGFRSRVPIWLRLLFPVLLLLSIAALVVGARWILAWDHGPDYDATFDERPLAWPFLP